MAKGRNQLAGGFGQAGKPPAERDPSKLQIDQRLDDLRLVTRIALSGVMTPEQATKFRDDVQVLFDNCKDERQKAAFGKVLASLHKTSMTAAIAAIKIENDIEIPPTQQTPTVTNNFNIMSVVEEARRDPSYVQFERQRAIEARTITGPDGSNGKSRQVESGPASDAD